MRTQLLVPRVWPRRHSRLSRARPSLPPTAWEVCSGHVGRPSPAGTVQWPLPPSPSSVCCVTYMPFKLVETISVGWGGPTLSELLAWWSQGQKSNNTLGIVLRVVNPSVRVDLIQLLETERNDRLPEGQECWDFRGQEGRCVSLILLSPVNFTLRSGTVFYSS